MRHALVSLAIIEAVASVVLAIGQERPDFSGTWTYDAAHSSKTSQGLRVGPDGTRTVNPNRTLLHRPPSAVSSRQNRTRRSST